MKATVLEPADLPTRVFPIQQIPWRRNVFSMAYFKYIIPFSFSILFRYLKFVYLFIVRSRTLNCVPFINHAPKSFMVRTQ